MNWLNALRLTRLLSAATEGSPSSSPAPATTITEPLINAAGTVPSDGAAPAGEAGGEGSAPQAAPAEVAPLTREDLQLGEGFSDFVLEKDGDKEVTALDRALEIMNNAELAPRDRLQKLVELQSTIAQRLASDAEAAWVETQTTWRKEVTELPEIGGKQLPETLAIIKKGLDQVGADDAFYTALKITGASNNPHVVKVLFALTKNLSEGKPVLGAPPKGKLSVEDRLYPTMQKEQ